MARADAVLFDLDGTLADSAPDLAGAANDLRAAHGLAPLPLDHLRPMVGGMTGASWKGDQGDSPSSISSLRRGSSPANRRISMGRSQVRSTSRSGQKPRRSHTASRSSSPARKRWTRSVLPWQSQQSFWPFTLRLPSVATSLARRSPPTSREPWL